eukprot:2290781-Karenia_brevis.AAC.1
MVADADLYLHVTVAHITKMAKLKIKKPTLTDVEQKEKLSSLKSVTIRIQRVESEKARVAKKKKAEEERVKKEREIEDFVAVMSVAEDKGLELAGPIWVRYFVDLYNHLLKQESSSKALLSFCFDLKHNEEEVQDQLDCIARNWDEDFDHM